MALFKSFETFINECGLSHMMIKIDIISTESVNGITEGKYFNSCKRLHPLTALGLQILQFLQFLIILNLHYTFLKELIDDEVLKYREMQISGLSTMTELITNETLSEILSKI